VNHPDAPRPDETRIDESRVVTALRGALHRIAPEIDFDRLDRSADFREEADLDSVDLVNLAVIIHQTLDVDIPESDYGKTSTLEGLIKYLVGRLQQSQR
jgi:acyl carrier protein